MNQNIIDFVGQVKIPVKVIVKAQLAERMDGGYNTSTYTFPDYILLTNVQLVGSVVHICFFADGMFMDAYVKKDFKLGKLPKGIIKELINDYNHFALFDERLQYGGHIGSDPEIFVEDQDGKVIPAFKFLGSKEKPTMSIVDTANRNNGGLPVFWDGFQAEFNTRENTCLAYHIDSIQNGLKAVLQNAQKFDKNAKLSLKTVMDIPPEILSTASPEHVAFGCMPSFNAYGLKGLEANGRDVPFRTAGGHIHFGMSKLTEVEIASIVRALDAILGVACVSLFEGIDDAKRRQMYGLVGEYRLPKHGLEYRALSNAWLCHPLITNIVFDLARQAFMFGKKGLNSMWVASEKDVIDTIQFCDVKKARKILNKNKDILAILLSNVYLGAKGHIMQKVFMNGVSSAIKDPSAIAENWCLTGPTKWISHCAQKDKNVDRGAKTLFMKQKVA